MKATKTLRYRSKSDWKLIFFVWILFSVIACGDTFAQANPLWGDLKPGPYSVGFQTISQYDVSRPFKRKFDYDKKLYEGQRARPVQISIWYPASKSAENHPMLFEEYVFLTSKEETFGNLTEKDKENAMNGFLNSSLAHDTDQEKLKSILKVVTIASSNATPEKGKFPLVLIAPSIGISSPYGNSKLSEYLASNGYVVATSPGMGEDSRTLTFDAVGITAQMMDMMMVIRAARERPDVDPDHLAIIGFSFGGLAGAVLSMHNSDVDAFISLDSSLANKWAYSQVFQSPLYEPNSLTAPVLHVTAQEPNEGTDLAFFKSLKYANVSYVKVKGMRAVDFSSLGMITTVVPKYGGETKGNPAMGQEAVCKYILNFLNANVKGDSTGQQFLKATPAENGFAADFVLVESKPGFKAPPTEEQFVQIIQQKGIDQAAAIYAEVKKNDPEYHIFEPETLNGMASELLQAKKTKDAIEILKLSADAFSNEWETFDLLGTAYMQDGNNALAVENFTKSLDLNPENTNASEMLKKLKKS